MITLTDQLGREIILPDYPSRIISTVPSQTELLFHLGLGDHIIGITKFCTHPIEQVKSKTKIGGTKQLDIDLIKSLNPDLIIANKEENERTQLEQLMELFPTYVSNPDDLLSALQMINDVGKLTNRETLANRLAENISNNFNLLPPLPANPLRVLYLIWRKPYMAAGKNTFIDDMLNRCGFVNAIDGQRYPEVTPEILKNSQADVVLLSSEPYPFSKKHIAEFAAILPNANIKLVDGEMFSWYGSRLLQSPGYFITLINSLKQV